MIAQNNNKNLSVLSAFKYLRSTKTSPPIRKTLSHRV